MKKIKDHYYLNSVSPSIQQGKYHSQTSIMTKFKKCFEIRNWYTRNNGKVYPHLSVLIIERTSPNVNFLIEETRSDSECAKPHNIKFIKDFILSRVPCWRPIIEPNLLQFAPKIKQKKWLHNYYFNIQNLATINIKTNL